MGDELDRARREAALSYGELFIRYFELGGMRSAFELEALCYGALVPTAHDHDVVAQALNERFSELGRDRLVPYADKDGGDQ